MAVPGTVILRYLTPIQPEEAHSRAQMARLLRKRMLLGLMKGPEDQELGVGLTWPQRLVNLAHLVTCFATIFFLWQYLPIRATFDRLEVSHTKGLLLGFGLCMLITVLMYLYLLYFADWVSYFWSGRKGKGQSQGGSRPHGKEE